LDGFELLLQELILAFEPVPVATEALFVLSGRLGQSTGVLELLLKALNRGDSLFQVSLAAVELVRDAVVLDLQVLVELLLLGGRPLELVVAPLDEVMLLDEDVVVALEHVPQLVALDTSQLFLIADQCGAVGTQLTVQDADLRAQFLVLPHNMLLGRVHLRELGTFLVELLLHEGDGLLV
jgi:hypothetical protein